MAVLPCLRQVREGEAEVISGSYSRVKRTVNKPLPTVKPIKAEYMTTCVWNFFYFFVRRGKLPCTLHRKEPKFPGVNFGNTLQNVNYKTS